MPAFEGIDARREEAHRLRTGENLWGSAKSSDTAAGVTGLETVGAIPMRRYLVQRLRPHTINNQGLGMTFTLESEGGGMPPTQLRTIGWSTWTVLFVLLILILIMVYLTY